MSDLAELERQLQAEYQRKSQLEVDNPDVRIRRLQSQISAANAEAQAARMEAEGLIAQNAELVAHNKIAREDLEGVLAELDAEIQTAALRLALAVQTDWQASQQLQAAIEGAGVDSRVPTPWPLQIALADWIARAPNDVSRQIREGLSFALTGRLLNTPRNYNAQSDVDQQARQRRRQRQGY